MEHCRPKVIECARYVLKVDWSSLDLMSCPELQKLQRWIEDGTIQAIGTFDRDRLQAQGLQRLVFLAECKERGVRIVTVQGVPMLDGGEGQLVEMALALGKERSVMRAQQGARDSLPASPVNFYGYEWNRERSRYQPNEHYSGAVEVWKLGLSGKSMRGIATELTRMGIQTPGGAVRWWSLWPRLLPWPNSLFSDGLTRGLLCGATQTPSGYCTKN